VPIDDLHREVARVALSAAAGFGFALGGGNALIAHGVTDRPTEDVDLFTDRERGVKQASGAVQAALVAAGFAAEPQDKVGWLSEVFYGAGDGLAEWLVTAPDGRQMALQMAYFGRSGAPVVMEFGPVLDLEDVLGGKVAALASRAYEVDYADVGRALGRYSVEELIGFARRLDPGLTGEDFADAGRRLDQLDDVLFADAGIAAEDVATIRERFADWPRTDPKQG
jgi:Nucleotidyl transferase AbiEii toxin, Type IV TA system